ncbi:glycosyltransferase family 2 protein [Paracoccus sp. M683]|uniref:glycosyltransferase family 2 protein n=1 Tax=Paracoccus sp. M683 TaxID=2594268 RepID=UPI0011800E1A|nr:glycosyltransferase family 2 protein [Paracoccus sp. M683]TRW95783.1 glycosyltransferase family 2 protein [Paracoccus sp. M683]
MIPFSIIIPASNEAGYIGRCLISVLDQDYPGPVQIIVVANGCKDDTADRAARLSDRFAQRGWHLLVLERAEGSKIGALNLGDEHAAHGHRLYLDADITMDPDMLGALSVALADDRPLYAGGRLVVAPSRSAVTRAYGRFWSRLPFMTTNVTGAGLFAVNPAGRGRWDQFPQVISDDTYVRLHFAESERLLANSGYLWPMANGFGRLVRVRRRQDLGVREIARIYPDLLRNEGSTRPGRLQLLGLALRDPIGFLTYAAVALAVRAGRGDGSWSRGR